MKVIEKKVKNLDKVYILLVQELNMMECGKMIKNMVKALMNLAMGINILVHGLEESNMD